MVFAVTESCLGAYSLLGHTVFFLRAAVMVAAVMLVPVDVMGDEGTTTVPPPMAGLLLPTLPPPSEGPA